MLDNLPTTYNQRQDLFYEKNMDENLSELEVLKRLAKFLGGDIIEYMDDGITDLVLDERFLYDLNISKG